MKKYILSFKGEELFFFITGILLFIYLFSSLYLFADFSLMNEVRAYLITLVYGAFYFILLFAKTYKQTNRQFSITIIDMAFFLCLFCFLYWNHKSFNPEILILGILYVCFRNLKLMTKYFLFIVLIVCTIEQYYFGYTQLEGAWEGFRDVRGIYEHPGVMGCFMALMVIICVGLWIILRRKITFISLTLFVIALIGGIFILYTTKSRTAWLALATGLFLLGIWHIKNVRYRFIFVLIPILFFIVSFKGFYDFKKDSADGRRLIWSISWEMFKEKPLQGYGYNGFTRHYMDAQALWFEQHPGSEFERLADEIAVPYNEFLRIAVDNGLPGLLLVLTVLFFSLRVGNKTSWCRLLKAVLCSMIIVGLFTFYLSVIQFKVLYILVITYLSQLSHPSFVWQLPLRRVTKAIILGSGVLLFSSLTVQILGNYRAINTWRKALATTERNQSIYSLEEVYPQLKDNPFFLRSLATKYRSDGRIEHAIDVLEHTLELHASYYTHMELGKLYECMDDDDRAARHFGKAANMIPSRFYPEYLLIKLYIKKKDFQRAQTEYMKFLHKPVKVDSPEIDFMKLDLQKELFP